MKGVLLAIALLLAPLCTAWVPEPALAAGGDVATQDEIRRDFVLTGTDGTPVHWKDFRGKVVALYFGFTTCPDICPTTMTKMKQVVRRLGPDADDLAVLFVTVDPERDTPERLRTYLDYFNPAFVGLTGPRDKISRIAGAFGTKFRKVESDSAAGYLIAHTDLIYLIDRGGVTWAKHDSSIPVDRLLADVEALLD